METQNIQNEEGSTKPQLETIAARRRFIAAAFSVSVLIGAGMAIAAAHPLGGASSAQSALAGQAVLDMFDGIEIEARSAIALDLTNGKVLYAKNPDEQRPLASLTKVMTIHVAAQVLDPDQNIKVSHDAVVRGESGGPNWGEEWSARDLMDYTLIASSNVGAEALAEAADFLIREQYADAPDDGSATVWRMNAVARELGMTETYFLNPSGLDIGTTTAGAEWSARDMARLFGYLATTSPDLYAATTRRDISLSALHGKTRDARNTNDALPEIPGLIIGKTGSTDLAGGNLAVVFDVGIGHPVAIVVLGSSEKGRFFDAETLVDSVRKSIAMN